MLQKILGAYIKFSPDALSTVTEMHTVGVSELMEGYRSAGSGTGAPASVSQPRIIISRSLGVPTRRQQSCFEIVLPPSLPRGCWVQITSRIQGSVTNKCVPLFTFMIDFAGYIPHADQEHVPGQWPHSNQHGAKIWI